MESLTVKWDFSVISWSNCPGGIRIAFETPWGPPDEFLRTLSARYPQATIVLAYAESGTGFWGAGVFHCGKEEPLFERDGGMFVDGAFDDGDRRDIDELIRPEVQVFLDTYGVPGIGG